MTEPIDRLFEEVDRQLAEVREQALAIATRAGLVLTATGVAATVLGSRIQREVGDYAVALWPLGIALIAGLAALLPGLEHGEVPERGTGDGSDHLVADGGAKASDRSRSATRRQKCSVRIDIRSLAGPRARRPARRDPPWTSRLRASHCAWTRVRTASIRTCRVARCNGQLRARGLRVVQRVAWGLLH